MLIITMELELERNVTVLEINSAVEERVNHYKII